MSVVEFVLFYYISKKKKPRRGAGTQGLYVFFFNFLKFFPPSCIQLIIHQGYTQWQPAVKPLSNWSIQPLLGVFISNGLSVYRF